VGSNTSTVTLRVVGGDEKGSLKTETVKYGREIQGTRTRENCAGEGQQHIQKTDPSSRQRGRPTKTRPYLSNKNKYLVMSPRWGSTPRLTDWPTVSRNVTLTLTWILVQFRTRYTSWVIVQFKELTNCEQCFVKKELPAQNLQLWYWKTRVCVLSNAKERVISAVCYLCKGSNKLPR
jgi:hypothetical protein